MKDWDTPYSFFNPVYQVKSEDGVNQALIGGGVGQFLGVW
jgi:amino acid transporter